MTSALDIHAALVNLFKNEYYLIVFQVCSRFKILWEKWKPARSESNGVQWDEDNYMILFGVLKNVLHETEKVIHVVKTRMLLILLLSRLNQPEKWSIFAAEYTRRA